MFHTIQRQRLCLFRDRSESCVSEDIPAVHCDVRPKRNENKAQKKWKRIILQSIIEVLDRQPKKPGKCLYCSLSASFRCVPVIIYFHGSGKETTVLEHIDRNVI